MVYLVSKTEAILLTKADLERVLSYDPETGVFRWKVSLRGPVRVGAIAGRLKPSGYISIKIRQVDYYAHRLAHLYMAGNGRLVRSTTLIGTGPTTDGQTSAPRLSTSSVAIRGCRVATQSV